MPPTGSNLLVLDGVFIDMSEGNRLRRMVIGLGAGASKLNAVVQVYRKTDEGSRELIDFSTTADSGYMPGAGITGPAGAAAGGATAAASLGVNIAAGGVKKLYVFDRLPGGQERKSSIWWSLTTIGRVGHSKHHRMSDAAWRRTA